MFIALVTRRHWHLGGVLSMGRWKWKPGEWETHTEPMCSLVFQPLQELFPLPSLVEPTLESLRFAQLGYSSLPPSLEGCRSWGKQDGWGGDETRLWVTNLSPNGCTGTPSSASSTTSDPS